MTTSTDSYRRDLVLALRMGNVPPDRIGEIVAEVESHVADTGESPVEAFGPPREYAAGFARPRRAGDVVSLLVLTGFGAACGWLLATGVVGTVRGETFLGFPAWTALVLGALLWIPPLLASVRRNASIRDPRTGGFLAPPPAAVVLTMSGFLALLTLGLWVGTVLAG
ncbi:hypothetical protein GCU56_13620 [Geodermatophilus sabuli]|uniref:Uncharacterized protein n=1 Tax=Geodermatophilus sabuli TaxID=1564158 RepID=A0A7K3W420_9ACTN|nr:hypothetical protein [Geodermatophilus sabuli]NEK58904.1 hypothetical protein [Geodermatophilus sabuli]